MQTNPIWDLATRLFHWILVCAFVTSWLASEFEEAELHAISGYVVLVALLFRIIWGFVGSAHSRFSDFLRGPTAVKAYVTSGNSPTPGHNPLGGWSVIALLGVLSLQVGTGLFLTDDVLFDAPFRALVDESTASTLAFVHEINFYVLTTLIILHLGAVAYYLRVKGKNLIVPMLTGGSGGTAPARHFGLALILVVIVAAAVFGVFELAPEPDYDF